MQWVIDFTGHGSRMPRANGCISARRPKLSVFIAMTTSPPIPSALDLTHPPLLLPASEQRHISFRGFRAIDHHHGNLSVCDQPCPSYTKVSGSYNTAAWTTRCCHHTDWKANHQITGRPLIIGRIYSHCLWRYRFPWPIRRQSSCRTRMHGSNTLSRRNGQATSQTYGRSGKSHLHRIRSAKHSINRRECKTF